MLRTHTCGELRKEHGDKEVTLCGWVNARRDHGKLIFIDVRDRYGFTQVVFVPSVSKEAHDVAQKLGPEFVIRVTGKVVVRPEKMVNKDRNWENPFGDGKSSEFIIKKLKEIMDEHLKSN